MTTTHTEILERMLTRVQGWEAAGDRRAVFLDCYRLMTVNMLAALEAGEFEDREWVHALLHRFAGYYFEALDAYDAGDPVCPAVWQQAHDAARDPGPGALQNLLLGVNAHINYDLVLALVEMLDTEWPALPEEARRRRYRDHGRVNTIIGRTVDTVQDQVIAGREPELELVDRLFGRLDEWLASRLITRWRETVWQRAVDLLDTPDALEREGLRRRVEDDTLSRSRAIMLQDGPASLERLF